jgi:hypothetical protein
VEGLCKDTSDSSPLPIGSSLWKEQYRFPFWAISNNKDHFPAPRKAFPFAESTGFPTGFICDFIKHGATNNPEELIERRKLFSELSKEGVLEKLSADLDELHKALNRVENAGRFALNDYPQALLNAIDLSMNKLKEATHSSDNSEYVRALGLVRQSLKLIRHHCEIVDEDNIFDSWLYKLEKIEQLEIQKEACLLQQNEEADERRPGNVAQLVAEQTKIEKQIKSILTGDGHLLFQCLPQMLNQIKPLIEESLQTKSLLDMELEALKDFHQATKDLLAPRYYKPWMQDLQTVVAVAAYINDERRPAGDLIDTLLSIDSVHLNQYANYLRPILELFFSCGASGQTIFSEFISANRNQSDRGERTGKAIKWATMDQVSSLRFIHELWQFEGLLTLAKAIRDGAKDNFFAPVEFHGGREILITDGWNITKPPSKQVSYDRNFTTGQQVEFSVGANMSGKTFGMWGLTWSLQFAQATGWAPGSRASLPILDQIIYIGRVPERRDLNLSAFGTEVYYWKEVVSAIQSGNHIYVAADEPFSSAPESYQDAFDFAVAALAAKYGTVLTIATHCQKPAKHFVEANAGLAGATHHQTSFDQAGNPVFEYIKRPGFGDSDALKVAGLLGLEQEILDIAAQIHQISGLSSQ